MTSTARKLNQGGSFASAKSRGNPVNNRVITVIAVLFGLVSVIALAVVLFLVLLFPVRAQAAEPRSEPSVLVTTSVGYPVSLRDGATLAPGIGHGLAIVVPVRDGWSYVGEISATTSFTALRPSLVLITGSSKKLAPDFVLGGSIFYKFTPPYDGARAATHVLGGSIAHVIPIAIGSLSFPVGIGVNLATGDPTLAFNLKLAIKVN